MAQLSVKEVLKPFNKGEMVGKEYTAEAIG